MYVTAQRRKSVRDEEFRASLRGGAGIPMTRLTPLVPE